MIRKHYLLFFFIFWLRFSFSYSSDSYHPKLVSLSPSLTETLSVLGGIDLLLGVTNHCLYPPSVSSLPKVGGYLSPNLEVVYSLSPDVILLSGEQHFLTGDLSALNLSFSIFPQNSLSALINSFTSLGELIGYSSRGLEVSKRFSDIFSQLSSKSQNLPCRRVLIILTDDSQNSDTGTYYCIGDQNIFSELLTLAGGVNVYTGNRSYPILSVENIIALNPEFIITLNYTETPSFSGIITKLPKNFFPLPPNILAVSQDNLYSITSDYTYIPGPRMLYLLRDFLSILHPDLLTDLPFSFSLDFSW